VSVGLNPSRAVLGNGAVVISRQTRKTPAVTVNLAVRAGSVVDPPHEPGAMHLLGRVIDRGTATRTAADIAAALDDRGISLSVSVSRRLFSLTCTCLAVDVEPVLSLLGEMVMTPSVPESELAIRKRQVVTGLRQDEDNPAVRAVEAVLALLYGADHAYGRGIKGTAASVEALTRERLLALHASRFGPALLSAVVVGDVESSRVEACAGAVFEHWRNETVPLSCPAQPRPASGRRFVAIPMMNKAQTDIAYGFVSISRADPSYYAFLLMNNVLGEYAMGGRLGHRIREQQGMAYYVSSSFDASVIAGPLLVRAGVAAGNVERAIASIDEELDALRRTGVRGRELAAARQYLVGSMPRALETNAGIAGFLQNAELFGLGLDYDRRLPNLLTAVTIDDVNATAAALDPANATIAVAGPYPPA
jgi:zinc protease